MNRIPVRFLNCMRATLIVCLCLTMISPGCATQTPDESALLASPDIRVDLFEGQTTFPYEASREKRQRIVNAVSQVELGMTRLQVYELLGPPDYYHANAAKESPEVTGWTMTYYFSAQSQLVNMKDNVLSIYFSKNDECTWVCPQNLPIVEKGGHGGARPE